MSMLHQLRRVAAVVEKDVRSELRTRYGITALGLFVLTSVTLIVFAVGEEPLPRPMAAGILWVIMFYSAMTGLGRGFISEEERGTALFLRLNSTLTSIFLGKLVVNIVLAVVTSIAALVLMMLFFSQVTIGSWLVMVAAVTIGSIGLAAVLSIVSAIVAKAGTRNPILPVLSFPLLVPLVMPGVNAMILGLAGFTLAEASSDLLLMTSYTGIVIVVSVVVFEVVWDE